MMHEWLLWGADPALLLCLLHSCFPKRQMCPNHDSVRPFSPPFKSIISNPSAKRSLKRSLSSPRTTSSQRAGCLLPSAVFLSSIFWHRSLQHSRVRSHHPRALLTRVKNLCLDNEFAESKEDRLNRRDRLARASSPREEAPSLRQGRPPRVSLRYSARGRELGRYPVLRTSTLERHSSSPSHCQGHFLFSTFAHQVFLFEGGLLRARRTRRAGCVMLYVLLSTPDARQARLLEPTAKEAGVVFGQSRRRSE
jgi:hypothetical protein